MSFSNPTVIMFAVYILVMLGIGIIAYRSTKSSADYVLGGRRLGSFVTAMSAGASDMSGWLLMGLPGAVYATGLVESWIAIGLTIGAYLNWLFVAGRLRVHTEYANNALTLPDYFYHRFGGTNVALKIVPAFIILLFFTVYCASGVVAGGRLFENLFGIPYETALWYGALATIIYTFLGGFLAVSWTDTVQATLMMFALTLAPIFVLFQLGGFDEMQMAVMQAGELASKSYTDMFPEGTTTIGLLSLMAWGLGYCGQPHIVTRFMAADSVQSLHKARRISITWMIICLAGAVAVGYFGIPYFHAHPELAGIVSKDSEQVFIEMTKALFNPWVGGLLLAAIIAAVMSTLSCQLLISATAITEDLYKGLFRKNAGDQELIWLGRFMVLAVAVVAIFIAQDPESKVLALVSNAWAGFGSAFGPVVVLSLFWRRMTGAGALAGMIIGALIVKYWDSAMAGSSLADVYEMIPAFISATVAIIVVSLITPTPHQDVLDKFDQADADYKRQ
ncbi:MAG: sodium/proline symporter PutP [Acinetobacter sp.]|nr:sodium/proline symporter PutP [Acinetobacter sp.]